MNIADVTISLHLEITLEGLRLNKFVTCNVREVSLAHDTSQCSMLTILSKVMACIIEIKFINKYTI